MIKLTKRTQQGCASGTVHKVVRIGVTLKLWSLCTMHGHPLLLQLVQLPSALSFFAIFITITVVPSAAVQLPTGSRMAKQTKHNNLCSRVSKDLFPIFRAYIYFLFEYLMMEHTFPEPNCNQTCATKRTMMTYRCPLVLASKQKASMLNAHKTLQRRSLFKRFRKDTVQCTLWNITV